MTRRGQALVAGGTLLSGLALLAGATTIPGDAGYGGVGPNFLPWVVGIALALCGIALGAEVARGGFRQLDTAPDEAPPHWAGFGWVSAGLLANAALITRLGFILGCSLCFMLAVRGFRSAQGATDRGLAGWLKDALLGAAIAAPVYWMFTQLLAIQLPGLTGTGWI
ncbi:tripartite tricarboxylate transporter TctB family protein [Piscinibacter sakaiensis]|uniref:Tricarboxylate transport protein TctB n=1 Tax=Piscinibacter sakaiensis TaxID=1547922 RepID=A0A0K8NW44_PISS1|nr:tripartite tricarboxylate transporter TctB family protein [Piscinibacter sakaiensis]GAP34606.1 tricarboxylate transport protein TctB [Piscinibacter sakaiensis]